MADEGLEVLASRLRELLDDAGVDLGDPGVRAALVGALTTARPDRRYTAAEKRALAVRLRAQGMPYDQIAAACGWASKATAWRSVQRALADLPREGAEDLRALELETLATLQRAVWPNARKGDPKAVVSVLRILRERRRYVPGLEVPSQDHQGAMAGSINVTFTLPEPDRSVTPVPQARLYELPAAGG